MYTYTALTLLAASIGSALAIINVDTLPLDNDPPFLTSFNLISNAMVPIGTTFQSGGCLQVNYNHYSPENCWAQCLSNFYCSGFVSNPVDAPGNCIHILIRQDDASCPASAIVASGAAQPASARTWSAYDKDKVTAADIGGTQAGYNLVATNFQIKGDSLAALYSNSIGIILTTGQCAALCTRTPACQSFAYQGPSYKVSCILWSIPATDFVGAADAGRANFAYQKTTVKVDTTTTAPGTGGNGGNNGAASINSAASSNGAASRNGAASSNGAGVSIDEMNNQSAGNKINVTVGPAPKVAPAPATMAKTSGASTIVTITGFFSLLAALAIFAFA